MQKIKIFISSPGDVGQERMIAERVIERLQGQFAAYLDLEAILWEYRPMLATSHFQDQIAQDMSSLDILIGILWSRLGTQLPSHYVKADGSPYLSGTEWEFETAAQLFRETGRPSFLVYRKTKEVEYSGITLAERQEKEKQLERLEDFWHQWFGDHKDGFRAAYTPFETPSEFEDKLEIHLRDVLLHYIPEFAVDGEVAHAPHWLSGSPFRGLEVFNQEHAPVFFGRTKAISEIQDLLVRQAKLRSPFLLVFGRSGCGKSSLIRAGVLPTITHPGVIEEVDMWRQGIFRPGDGQPILALANALLEALPELTVRGYQIEQLHASLQSSAEQTVEEVRQAVSDAENLLREEFNSKRQPVLRLLLVIDQFEELFTMSGMDEKSRELFIHVLTTLVKSGFIWIIATMRSDFYARCAEIPQLTELKAGSGQYDLLPPSFTEIGQIIEKPAAAAGLFFEKNIETGLSLRGVLHEAAAGNPSALPLLEFTLHELYNMRRDQILTFAAYEDLGGIEGALARYADGVVSQLPSVVQDRLSDVLRLLVTISSSGDEDEKVSSQRARYDELVNEQQRRQLVLALLAARLLVADADPSGVSFVGVAHEALLRSWPKVQSWVADEKDFLKTRAWLTDEAAHWHGEGQLPEYLLTTGKPLRTAVEVLQTHKNYLGVAVCNFIEASQQQERKRIRKRRGIGASIAVLVLVLFYSFLSTSWGEKFVELRHDIETVVAGRIDIAAAEKFNWVSNEVTFIDIDQTTYLAWGKPIMTPHDKLAELIEKAWKSGAKVIALDIFLDEADFAFPERDQYLRDVLTALKADPNGPKIIFPVQVYHDSTLGKNLFDDLIDNETRFFRSVPWSLVASTYDNKMRFWYPYGIFHTGQQTGVIWGTPLLAAVLADGSLEELKQAGDDIVATEMQGGNINKQRQFVLKTEDKASTVSYSAKDKMESQRIKYYLIPDSVLKKDDPGNLFMKSFKVSELDKILRLKKDIFKDKIVIIGNSSPDKNDSYATPVGQMPGMFIHGNVINCILKQL